MFALKVIFSAISHYLTRKCGEKFDFHRQCPLRAWHITVSLREGGQELKLP